MAEKYLKCPNCGAGNPEGKKFCGDCGVMIPQPPPPVQPAQPMYVQPTPSWIGSNWKGLVSVVVVVLVVLSVVGLVYNQPWSKIKVIVSHSEYSQIGVNVYIDGVLKGSVGVSPGTTILGVWSVEAGTHTVEIDSGDWYVEVITHWFSPDEYVNTYIGPDGVADFSYAYEVGPLTTKNAFIQL